MRQFLGFVVEHELLLFTEDYFVLMLDTMPQLNKVVNCFLDWYFQSYGTKAINHFSHFFFMAFSLTLLEKENNGANKR